MIKNVHTIICELCTSNILTGIVHRMKNGMYVCDDCKCELEKSDGVYFDGHKEVIPSED